MALNRYRVIWSGGPGGEGVSTFYSDTTVTTALADLRTFFDALKGICATGVTWTFPNSGDVIDLATGQITGGWSQPVAAQVATTGGSAAYAAGVGLRIRWNTGSVINGRRVRGATFITGLLGSNYQSDGSIAAATLSTAQAAADALVGQSWLEIYTRNFAGGGAASPVLSATVPDRVSWLRTRRA